MKLRVQLQRYMLKKVLEEQGIRVEKRQYLLGVVLLMAMFGAVVLARRRIDLGEDALRASAGLATLSPDESDEGAR